MLTGYSANLPSDVLLDSGVLYVGASPIGVSRGGWKWDPAREFRQVGFDGQHAPVKGLDRPIHGEPVITGQMIEFGDSATGNQIGKFEPGSSSASAGSPNVTTITPKTGGALAASSDYLTDVRLVFERGIGTGTKRYAAIYFPSALLRKYALSGTTDKGEAVFDVEIAARLVVGSDTGAAAYKIELREALPS